MNIIPSLPIIPLPYRILIAIAVLAAVYALGNYHGANRVQTSWDLEKAQQAEAAANTATEQANATVKVVTEFVDRVQVVREKGKTIIKEVPVYVPSTDSCDLSGGFRVLHDAAAANTLPDSTRVADAPAANAQTVAATVAENYNTCHGIREQLIGLQAWAAAQGAIR